MWFLHWFYKGCPRNMVFYIGFTREPPGQLADTPDMVLHQQQQQQAVNSPHNTSSYTIESLIFARSLTRTHKQNKTIAWEVTFARSLVADPPNLQAYPWEVTFSLWFYIGFTLVSQGCPR